MFLKDATPRERHALSCDMVVVICCDWRIWEADLRSHLDRWRADRARYDLLTVPGGIHRLVHGPEHRSRTLLEDLDGLVAQGMPETIVMIQHTHCAVYRQERPDMDEAEEQEWLIDDIGEAWGMLDRRYPRISVQGYIAEVDVHAGRMRGLKHTRYSIPPVPPEMPSRV